MSVVDKLSILGIRAFGPNEEDRQVIQFEHPLTLIVGSNGAGKTTIIECLKFAATGEQPLNTKGGGFVHDPKLAHENQTRAKVQLKCKTIQGETIVVERGLTAVQKAKTISCTASDAAITKHKKNGEKVQITTKCVDLNREMVSALGVSKAVLTSVIFCHQEESNWPLDDGSSLKKRFDAMFDASRYIVALDTIRKLEKAKKGDLSNMRTELPHLKTYSDTVKEKNRELSKLETQIQTTESSYEQLSQEIEPVVKKMKEFTKLESEVHKLQIDLNSATSRKGQMVKDKENLENRIHNKFMGTDEELEDLLQSQRNDLDSNEGDQRNCQRRIDALNRQTEKLNKEKNNLSKQQGIAQTGLVNAEKLRKSRDEKARELSQQLSVSVGSLGDEKLSEQDVEDFEDVCKDYLSKQKQDLQELKAKQDGELRRADQQLMDTLQERAKYQEGRKQTVINMQEKKRKKAKIIRELSSLQSALDNDELERLEDQLKEAETEQTNFEGKTDVDAVQQEIRSQNRKKAQIQKDINSLENDISIMQKSMEARTKIEMMNKEKTAKEENLSKIKDKIKDMLAMIGFDECPNKSTLKQWVQRKEGETKNVATQLQRRRDQLAKHRAEHDFTKKQIEEKQNRCEDLENSMFDVCGSDDLDTSIVELEKEIDTLQNSKVACDGVQFVCQDYIKKLKPKPNQSKEDIPCPLCHRQFEEEAEVDELVKEIERKYDMAPKRLEKQIADLEKKERQLKVFNESKPIKRELDKLNAEDLPQLKERLSDLKTKMTAAQDKVTELEEQHQNISENESMGKTCLPDIIQIDNLQREIRSKTSEIQNLESRLPATSSSKSLDELTEEKKQLSNDAEKVAQDIERNRRKIEDYTNKLHKLKDNVNDIREEKLKLASDLQRCEQLKVDQAALSTEIAELDESLKNDEAKKETFDSKINELERRKTEVSKRNRQKLEEVNNSIRDLQNSFENMYTLNKKTRQSNPQEQERKLKEIQETLTKIENGVAQKSEEIKRAREELVRLQNYVATCRDRQRDLEDNKNLRERIEEIKKVEVDIEKTRTELGGKNADQIESELRKLSRQRESLIKERERLEERRSHYKQNRYSLKEELKQRQFVDADKKYRDQLIEITVMNLAIKDLSIYYKALDRAIMQYHKLSMDEINKSIKELWQETYKGRDIDYIQIVSDSNTGTSSSARRNINYRVVMYCGDTSMDMRGRCSAGQKVLASLVIRLALAETFCINCGVLALDEPTTNLDRDNIESLASALVSIIESRYRQRNFQLVIITHDEDFVEILGKSNYADHFFRVTKDDYGKSRIDRCDMRSLER